MKRLLCLLLCLMLLPTLSACGEETLTRYSYSFFGTFDTIIMLIGYAPDKDTFDQAAALCEREFQRLHQLFTPYLHSDGDNNLFNLNNGAWKEPMTVNADMMNLLLYCKEMQAQVPGTVNIAMGRMLNLWHQAREDAEDGNVYLPDMDALQDAAAHCSIDDVILDPKAMTVYYADPLLRLDLGCVAKGYAADLVAAQIAEILPHFSLNAGGNIVVGDGPVNELGQWKAGIQAPDTPLISDNNVPLATIAFNNRALVTSGDYQRYYFVDGVRYHHIIDPQTLMPASNMRAVTILAGTSTEADFLSTSAFLIPYEESRALIDSMEGVEALWVLNDGSVMMTDGFAALLTARE